MLHRLLEILARFPHVLWVMLLVADARSAANLLRVKGRMSPPVEDIVGVSGGATPLRLRALAPSTTFVRPGTSDTSVVAESLRGGYCLPPEEIANRPLRTVVELGSNIGLGLATLAVRFPEAQLLGVEADAENHALALHNTRPWHDRCTVIHAAAWRSNERLTVERDGRHASGFTVRAARVEEAGTVMGFQVDHLLRDRFDDKPIDYLYLDIEGAHHQILTADADWLRRVQAIKVSAHIDTPYDEHACAADLRAAGFETRAIETETTGWTVGIRPASAR
jgi:FkbM family methyltransferase